MPNTQTYSDARELQIKGPKIEFEFRWESLPFWGFDPAPSTAPTVTVGTSVNAAATAETDLSEQDPFTTAKAKLGGIRSEGTTELQSAQAEKLLAALAGQSLVPARVVLTADREIAFLFFGTQLLGGGAHRRIATITCSEDGLSAALQDRETSKLEILDVETERVSDVLRRVRDFISGQ